MWGIPGQFYANQAVMVRDTAYHCIGKRRSSSVLDLKAASEHIHLLAVVALSEDHKPNRESERKRIEGEGGVVIWAGTWRVGGVLAVSRAFGDRPLKRYVIALPDVRHEHIDGGEECVILASDGLWDVVSNKVRGLNVCTPVRATSWSLTSFKLY
jgi:hypothetical protein